MPTCARREVCTSLTGGVDRFHLGTAKCEVVGTHNVHKLQVRQILPIHGGKCLELRENGGSQFRCVCVNHSLGRWNNTPGQKRIRVFGDESYTSTYDTSGLEYISDQIRRTGSFVVVIFGWKVSVGLLFTNHENVVELHIWTFSKDLRC